MLGASQQLWGQDEAIFLRGIAGKMWGSAYVWEVWVGTCLDEVKGYVMC